ncbi:hypothetical protein HMPREF1557_02098 [Streptococcus sobrinus W1703]|uniref:Uncharacterized protein n=2 Tax=Streptococcus sobrinus TaxID=1310 RepID=U2IJ02_9STRE|nr:hypothetical protein HMPREF1557_02098 [Streptococcus sobrinus W1703]
MKTDRVGGDLMALTREFIGAVSASSPNGKLLSNAVSVTNNPIVNLAIQEKAFSKTGFIQSSEGFVLWFIG